MTNERLFSISELVYRYPNEFSENPNGFVIGKSRFSFQTLSQKVIGWSDDHPNHNRARYKINERLFSISELAYRYPNEFLENPNGFLEIPNGFCGV